MGNEQVLYTDNYEESDPIDLPYYCDVCMCGVCDMRCLTFWGKLRHPRRVIGARIALWKLSRGVNPITNEPWEKHNDE